MANSIVFCRESLHPSILTLINLLKNVAHSKTCNYLAFTTAAEMSKHKIRGCNNLNSKLQASIITYMELLKAVKLFSLKNRR